MLTTSGSVRVDLLGGTLDISPINLIIPNSCTINLATSLETKIQLEEISFQGIEIVSLDYNQTKKFSHEDFKSDDWEKVFGPLVFVARILDYFKVNSHLKIEISSGSPPGAGLGGSSTMGVVLFKSLSQWLGHEFCPHEAIKVVKDIEAQILNCGPTGYQDYYPSLFGGVLALLPKPGEVEVNQLFSSELKELLETHLTLVSSEESRLSGLNNWEIYKGFFNGDSGTIQGLKKISELSYRGLKYLREGNFSQFLKTISDEGEERANIFPEILTPKIVSFKNELRSTFPHAGLKICGAGGGGCFIVVHGPGERGQVEELILKHQMKVLPFSVNPPLSQ